MSTRREGVIHRSGISVWTYRHLRRPWLILRRREFRHLPKELSGIAVRWEPNWRPGTTALGVVRIWATIFGFALLTLWSLGHLLGGSAEHLIHSGMTGFSSGMATSYLISTSKFRKDAVWGLKAVMGPEASELRLHLMASRSRGRLPYTEWVCTSYDGDFRRDGVEGWEPSASLLEEWVGEHGLDPLEASILRAELYHLFRERHARLKGKFGAWPE